jgi:signal transduction histidine kinase
MMLKHNAIDAFLRRARWPQALGPAALHIPIRPRGAAWPSSDGEMSDAFRKMDWSRHALGSTASWPKWQKAAVTALLDSPVPTMLLLGNELFQIYNDAYRPLLGLRHPDALGRRAGACAPEAWPSHLALLREVLATGGSAHLPDQRDQMQAPSESEPRYFTLSYLPVRDDAGAVRGVAVAAVETTQRLRLENEHAAMLSRVRFDADQLRRLFDQAPGFMALLSGPEHRFEQVNPAYARLAGERQLLGRTMGEALPEYADPDFLDCLDRAYRDGVAFVVRGQAVALQHGPAAKPETRYVDAVYQPIFGPDGAVSGLFVQGQDVTAQTLATLELAAAARRKDEFLATLAHELRNPLAPIANVGTILSHPQAATGNLAAMGAILARQTAHMGRLIDDLLDTSRIGQGLLQLDLGPVDLHDVVAAAVEQAAPLMARSGHDFSVRVHEGPLVVRGDAARLVQVLANILHNAAKYTPHAGRVALAVEPSAGGFCIEVRDNGTGMEAAFLPLIFEPFSQAQRVPGRDEGGLGLGLALVRSLVELHGGTVHAGSAGLGLGSVFTVRLPRPAA